VRSWDPSTSYARSKIALTALALYVARHQPRVLVNAVHPGWVRSGMSGEEAPLSAEEGADTIVWLANGLDPGARTTGELFFERRPVRYNEQPHSAEVQDAVVSAFEALTDISLPPDPDPPAAGRSETA
jgi:NAD(P)-dependent dehydrogenase (short-subunit alcohol dehydrogenase family)